MAGVAPHTSQGQDDRVHFNTVSGKWTFEDDKGDEWEWDDKRAQWLPLVDEELLKAQQAAYSVAGVDADEPAAPVLARDKKRKKGDGEDGKSGKKSKGESKNTAIFISHLPLNTTRQQLLSVFSKAGLILEDEHGAPRIRMYHDPTTGAFKGEALVVYLMPDSVDLACRLLDETELELGSGDSKMRVKKAEWDTLPVSGGQDGEASTSSAATTGQDQPEKKPERTAAEKKMMGKRAQKQREKLADWSSDEEDNAKKVGRKPAKGAESRVVVLEGMFSLEELEEDPTLLLDLKEDVREECETLGAVTNVTLYDLEARGIMTVKFKDTIAAQACIIKMQGRFFAGRTVKASLFDGTERYRRSGKGGDHDVLEGTGFEEGAGGAALSEQERLDRFADWLEN